MQLRGQICPWPWSAKPWYSGENPLNTVSNHPPHSLV